MNALRHGFALDIENLLLTANSLVLDEKNSIMVASTCRSE